MTTKQCEHIYCNIKLTKNIIHKLYDLWKDPKQEQNIEISQWGLQEQQMKTEGVYKYTLEYIYKIHKTMGDYT